MAEQVKVADLATLERVRVALIHAAEAFDLALQEVDAEVQRAQDWLAEDRPTELQRLPKGPLGFVAGAAMVAALGAFMGAAAMPLTRPLLERLVPAAGGGAGPVHQPAIEATARGRLLQQRHHRRAGQQHRGAVKQHVHLPWLQMRVVLQRKPKAKVYQ